MITRNREETIEFAKKFLADLVSFEKPQNTATIVELLGDLGAGKTTFMAGIGQGLQIQEPIVSPTFLIQKNYRLVTGFPWKKLIHIDAYRIESEKELAAIGWDNYSKDKDNLIFIEWPENMQTKIDSIRQIKFKYLNENEREIEI
jgi:tRNA threonylcarbamoyladenosine biosynthesis protein TsaE